MRLESLVPMQTLQELVAKARSAPPGAFVEVGVYRGGSARLLHEVAVAQRRELHLFDTFEGIPFSAEDDKHRKGEFGDVDLPFMRRALPHATFHVGLFPDTLPNDLTQIAFAHVDCDQHDSVLACIGRLWPRLVPGAVMWFDDFELAGARRAILSRFSEKSLRTASNERRWIAKT